MTFLEIIELIAVILAVLAVSRIVTLNVYRFIRIKILYKDVACKVLKHQIIRTTINTKIKIAYAGSDRDTIRDILFTYRLKLPAPFDRFLAYVQIATAYLICDMQGLSTLLGTEYYTFAPMMVHTWKTPRLVKYPLSVLNGIFSFYMILLMMVIPLIGWMFLNWGPHGKFSLESIASDMVIKDENGNVGQLPIVLNPGDEIILDIRYKVGLNAKGFKIDTPYRFLNTFPARTFGPPKPGNFTWVGKGLVILFLGGKLNRLPIELDKKVIIGIGSQ